MLPLVSVVIPAYNHEKYVQQTIESILQQTYPEIELIVVNDGSTDQTWDVIQKMRTVCEQRFVNTIFINRENRGICRTFNEGIKLASGTYIKPIASDDYLVPTAIEMFVSYIESNPGAEIVFSDGFDIESDCLSNMKLNQGIIKRFSEVFPFENGDLFERLMMDVFLLPSPAVFYTKSLIERLGYYDESLTFEDVDFFLRAARETNFHFIHHELVYHRMHENNSGRNCNLLVQSAERLICKYDADFCKGKNNFLTLQITLSKNLAIIPVHVVNEMSKVKKIVVWGAGSFFERYKEKIPFSYVVDSHATKARVKWPNLVVKDPSALLEEQKGSIFIVVCSSFHQEIFNWLKQNGFVQGIDYI